MPKRYVCSECHGSGRQLMLDSDYPMFRDIEIDCPYCVAKGYPPFVEARAPNDNQIISAEFKVIIDEPAPAVQNSEQKDTNDNSSASILETTGSEVRPLLVSP